jgi:hypothetical protein
MGPKKQDNSPQVELFRNRLESMISMDHELLKLSRLIRWEMFDEHWGALFESNRGAPATPTRLIARLHYLKKLNTRVGRVARDIERQLEQHDAHVREAFTVTLSQTKRIMSQKRTDKYKLYSLHASEAECINKGKAHKFMSLASRLRWPPPAPAASWSEQEPVRVILMTAIRWQHSCNRWRLLPGLCQIGVLWTGVFATMV